jgi:hypothetical protein
MAEGGHVALDLGARKSDLIGSGFAGRVVADERRLGEREVARATKLR